MPRWLLLGGTLAGIYRVPRCSFCGLAQYRGVIGPGVNICEACIELCVDILSQDDAATLSGQSSPGQQ
jgi:hypothetical protein